MKVGMRRRNVSGGEGGGSATREKRFLRDPDSYQIDKVLIRLIRGRDDCCRP